MKKLLLPFFVLVACLMGDTSTRAITAKTASLTTTPWLDDVSTRAFVQTGDDVVIGGFIVQGTGPKRVIVRAIGSELTPYGVPNALADPTLELHDATGALIASNDNWQTTVIGGIITYDQVQQIQSSGLAPGDPRESAIIGDLPPGNYTAIVRGINNSTGVALVEVSDLNPGAIPPSTLENVSTRAFVQTGDNVMIGGFIVQGTEPQKLIVRAIGPELTQDGVPNALADPTLELHDGTGALIASNDNWQTTTIGGIITSDQVGSVTSSGHAPSQASESAIVATLAPGNYTAIVRGANNTSGVGLVEVYTLVTPVTEQYGVGTSIFGDTPLYWDAYLIPTGTHPAVLVIHGGGFKDGEPGPASVAQDLNAAGFNVFAIDYRLAPPHIDMPRQALGDDGHYPEQTNDVATAIRAARTGSTAASFGKVTGKVGVVGGSAGASHAAYTAAAATVGGDMLDGAVLLSGAYDFHDPSSLVDTRCATFGFDVTNYVNSFDVSDGGALDLGSPYRRFTSSSAPVFVIATNLDPMPPEQYQILTTRLNAIGAPNQSLLITEAPGPDGCTRHSFGYWDDIKTQAIAFLNSLIN